MGTTKRFRDRAGRRSIVVVIGVTLITSALLDTAAGRGGHLTPHYTEYDVKAAALLNIAKHVIWPEGAFDDDLSPLVIAVLGSNPLYNALEGLASQRIGGRPIAIRQVQTVKGLGTCQILYVSEANSERLQRLNHELSFRPILTIGEQTGFATTGGIIALSIVDNHLAFDVNRARARVAGLTIGADLLKLARTVYNMAPEGDNR
ncbi:MAG: YfiR family protein [Verrucomicrobia bacterium]|nr:YfiR family protein [Verrucomicrobiota bacterium]